MMQIPIFRSGKHIAASGAALSFSEEDLRASIDAYDPAVHEAPIVVGHPRDNAPAFGWVSSLAMDGEEMVANVNQLDADFSEMVKAGRFKKRSASFYTPDAPSNPKPGIYYLRHVGFLGAQPPAVKGLKEIKFSEDESEFIEFSDEMVVGILALMMRRLREFFISEYGVEKAQSIVPDFMVNDIESEARKPQEEDSAQPAASFEENKEEDTMTPEQISEMEALKARAQELESKVAEYAEASAKAEYAARLAVIKGDLAALVSDGRVLPNEVDALAQFMCGLDDKAGVAEFADGETSRTTLEWFKSFLASRPKTVDYSEQAAGVAADDTPSKASDIAMRAREYRDAQAMKGRNISFTEATDAILRGAAQ